MDKQLVLMLALFFASFVLGYALRRLWQIESNHPDHCNHHWEFVGWGKFIGGPGSDMRERIYRCIRCKREEIGRAHV